METNGEHNSHLALPSYRCHKVVQAAKITGVEGCAPKSIGELIEASDIEGGLLNLEWPGDEKLGKGFGTVRVDRDYMIKHQPRVGGYYVVYADGYTSFSPAEAFEQGYSLITKEEEDEQQQGNEDGTGAGDDSGEAEEVQ